MEERLRNLKKAVDETAFKKLAFTSAHQQQIRKQLQPLPLQQTILAMLLEAKSGVELTQQLHVRGVEQIVGNEGMIHSILHEAEQQGWLVATWSDGVKYYALSKLGKKLLQQQEHKTKLSIKDRVMGVRMHAD